MRGPAEFVVAALDRVTPEQQRLYSARLLVGCVLAWPVSSLTVFRGGLVEQGILALSWLALIISSAIIVIQTDIAVKDQED